MMQNLKEKSIKPHWKSKGKLSAKQYFWFIIYIWDIIKVSIQS